MRVLIFAALFSLFLAGCPAPSAVSPTADFSASPAGGYSPVTVQFTDLSSPGSSPITNYYWNFGDGKTGTDASPVHTYTLVGKFTVTLRVVSAAGEGIAAKTRLIEVLLPPQGPRAHFSANALSGTAPLNVQFTDESTPRDKPITTWRWTFGDGAHSTLQNPLHTYTAPGAYTVSLEVANSLGTDTFTENTLVNVLPAP